MPARKFFPMAIRLPNPCGHSIGNEVEEHGWEPLIERQLGPWLRETGVEYRAPLWASLTPCGQFADLTIDIIGRANAALFKLTFGGTA
ncbi:hypothetical protein MRBLMC3_000130 [Sphingobium sp. LMC3-1-1.1]|uniref:hypothetical protein n=1 Tax=Sphingobium sp. LMC3-1-1.1 TaxID=3135241 RepID=UPI0034326F26